MNEIINPTAFEVLKDHKNYPYLKKSLKRLGYNIILEGNSVFITDSKNNGIGRIDIFDEEDSIVYVNNEKTFELINLSKTNKRFKFVLSENDMTKTGVFKMEIKETFDKDFSAKLNLRMDSIYNITNAIYTINKPEFYCAGEMIAKQHHINFYNYKHYDKTSNSNSEVDELYMMLILSSNPVLENRLSTKKYTTLDYELIAEIIRRSGVNNPEQIAAVIGDEVANKKYDIFKQDIDSFNPGISDLLGDSNQLIKKLNNNK